MSKKKMRMNLARAVIFRFSSSLHQYYNSLLFPTLVFLTALLWLLASSLVSASILFTHCACKHVSAMLHFPAQRAHLRAPQSLPCSLVLLYFIKLRFMKIVQVYGTSSVSFMSYACSKSFQFCVPFYYPYTRHSSSVSAKDPNIEAINAIHLCSTSTVALMFKCNKVQQAHHIYSTFCQIIASPVKSYSTSTSLRLTFLRYKLQIILHLFFSIKEREQQPPYRNTVSIYICVSRWEPQS